MVVGSECWVGFVIFLENIIEFKLGLLGKMVIRVMGFKFFEIFCSFVLGVVGLCVFGFWVKFVGRLVDGFVGCVVEWSVISNDGSNEKCCK